MGAKGLGCRVGGLADIDSTVFPEEVISVFHPGATATVATVKLAKQFSVPCDEVSLHVRFIIVTAVGTVHHVLLGEVLGRTSSGLDSKNTLDSTRDGELDAGTAATLILDGTHEAGGGVINSLSSVDETTTTTAETVVVAVASVVVAVVVATTSEELRSLAGIFFFETHHSLKLAFRQVTCEVHREDETIGSAALSGASVVLVDHLHG